MLILLHIIYSGPEGHSPIDGSSVSTLTIVQSTVTVDGWTFQPPTYYSSASNMRTLMIDGQCLNILTTHLRVTRLLNMDRQLMVPWIFQTTVKPLHNMLTLTIDDQWLDIPSLVPSFS